MQKIEQLTPVMKLIIRFLGEENISEVMQNLVKNNAKNNNLDFDTNACFHRQQKFIETIPQCFN